MPDALSLGLLGIAGNLLASLNSSNPKNDFEALKVIDENDPIRRCLSTLRDAGSLTVGTHIVLIDGTRLALGRVLEVGYGAARMVAAPLPEHWTKKDPIIDFEWSNMVLRYQAVRGISEPRRSNF